MAMADASSLSPLALLQRSPRRLSVTVNAELYGRLQELADLQGRSTSNLCAFLLERATESGVNAYPPPDA